ncbi:MAG: hypothetical protein QOG53_304 [Frankiales bacterium]|nr:hypothetical protein [Frankiales bacterium]
MFAYARRSSVRSSAARWVIAFVVGAASVAVGLMQSPARADVPTLYGVQLSLADNPIFEQVYGPDSPTACGLDSSSQPSFLGQGTATGGAYPGTMTFSGSVGVLAQTQDVDYGFPAKAGQLFSFNGNFAITSGSTTVNGSFTGLAPAGESVGTNVGSCYGVGPGDNFGYTALQSGALIAADAHVNYIANISGEYVVGTAYFKERQTCVIQPSSGYQGCGYGTQIFFANDSAVAPANLKAEQVDPNAAVFPNPGGTANPTDCSLAGTSTLALSGTGTAVNVSPYPGTVSVNASIGLGAQSQHVNDLPHDPIYGWNAALGPVSDVAGGFTISGASVPTITGTFEGLESPLGSVGQNVGSCYGSDTGENVDGSNGAGTLLAVDAYVKYHATIQGQQYKGHVLIRQRQTCSAGGSCGYTNLLLNFTDDSVPLDITPPALAPTVAPNPVVQNQSAAASANATDAESGVASSSCDPVDTSQLGDFTVTCTATNGDGFSDTADASYTVIPATKTLTVTVDGNAGGSVASQPAGIDCGATCSYAFDYNGSVTMTATPTAGATFDGWAGDCTGTADCVLTMSDDRSVTATFSDSTAPNTSITTKPPPATKVKNSTFRFTSTESGSTFQCKLDAGDYATCSSPLVLPPQSDGQHTFSVVATDPVGNADTSAATWTWIIDNVKPTTALTLPTASPVGRGDWDVYNPCTSLCGTAADDGSGVRVVKVEIIRRTSNGLLYWDGTAFKKSSDLTKGPQQTAVGTTDWVYAFPFANFPADGDYRVCAQGIDKAGNVSSNICVTFTVKRNKGGYFLPSTATWTGRIGHAATRLADGRVLFAGGFTNNVATATADIYDPTSGSVTPTADMPQASGYNQAVLLSNGNVLVVTSFGPTFLYTPSSGIWAVTGSPAVVHSNGILALLPSGKVLLAGGGYNTKTSEVYNPATGTWSAGGLMKAARRWAAGAVTGGKVLVAGGVDATNTVTSSVEVYTPSSNSWAWAAPMPIARDFATATTLSTGKVLVAGGSNVVGGVSNPVLTVEVFSPSTNSWSAAGSVQVGRNYHTATLLPSGKVLVAGGFGSAGAGTSAELYDPTANTWTNTGALSVSRSLATATLLPGGRVLVRGGSDASPGAETYIP